MQEVTLSQVVPYPLTGVVMLSHTAVFSHCRPSAHFRWIFLKYGHSV